ncbi:M24 family metallopeptidase [Planctomicrobium sp. SH664]|uniref:M24 family metallopeptidase n=1 Tax=Planctomicrobium sp. SH664 TaxID=3448125 RepID=UPI003F5B2257
MPSSDRYSRRRGQLRKLLKSQQLDALLVTGEANVTWLTGFTGDSTWLLLTLDDAVLLSDFRFVTQLAEESPDVEAVIRTSAQSLAVVWGEQVQRGKLERVGFESHLVTVESIEQLAANCQKCELFPASRLVESLRAVKDSEEIAELRTAIRFAERGFESLKATLTKGKTESQVAAELEFALRQFGADGLSFPAIVAVGDRAALPHYRAGKNLISASPILLVDWGAKGPGGYRSDLTRTLLTGKGDRKFEKVYRTVLQAQLEAIAAIRPGIECREVDEVARKVIREAGFGKYFDHGLGHGIGLDVHEFPRLSRGSTTVLRPGMVVTVEPGIYLPGWGGVRIEDDVLVTRQGCEVLSTLPKDWNSVHVDC